MHAGKVSCLSLDLSHRTVLFNKAYLHRALKRRKRRDRMSEKRERQKGRAGKRERGLR